MRRLLLLAAVLVFIPLSVAARERRDLEPRIVEISKAHMKAMLCGAEKNCDGPVALYRAGTIYIQPNLDIKSPRVLGMLLHEFVHHLQFLSGMEQTMCRGQREKQAYDVQREWLKTNGLKPDPKIDFPGPLKLFIIEQCEGW